MACAQNEEDPGFQPLRVLKAVQELRAAYASLQDEKNVLRMKENTASKGCRMRTKSACVDRAGPCAYAVGNNYMGKVKALDISQPCSFTTATKRPKRQHLPLA